MLRFGSRHFRQTVRFKGGKERRIPYLRLCKQGRSYGLLRDPPRWESLVCLPGLVRTALRDELGGRQSQDSQFLCIYLFRPSSLMLTTRLSRFPQPGGCSASCLLRRSKICVDVRTRFELATSFKGPPPHQAALRPCRLPAVGKIAIENSIIGAHTGRSSSSRIAISQGLQSYFSHFFGSLGGLKEVLCDIHASTLPAMPSLGDTLLNIIFQLWD